MSDMNFTIEKVVPLQPINTCIIHIAQMDCAEGTLKDVQHAQIIVRNISLSLSFPYLETV